ncbi:MAG: sn-glycerol-3-phosphate ABC transporter ATP-binding protein UgpC [Phycisphaeraceae bacterium]|nr:sn-glycerol-3-phosphate ABC transporter ATP-binding protein UgpC [Phycisphaeraceae bacterium]
MAEIRLESVTKVYSRGGDAAVDAVSLAVADGSFTVLVGPSGCGKSTTLRMVAGLEDVTAGQIVIGGKRVNEVAPRDRDIAMVFQNYALYPHMTVRENLGFALKMRKTPREEIDRRVRAAAQTLGIAELLDRKPGQLSGGQRQRVAVGRAIVREPKAFLFDEPLSNLDARLRVSTRAELKALHQRLRTTTLYVTHDQEEAMTLGDQVVVMCGGKVQQAGPPMEIYRRPANRFVAGFLGTPPMNFLPGTLSKPGEFDNTHFASEAINLVNEPFVFSFGRERSDRLKTHHGAPVVLGIRPQALALAAEQEQGRDFPDTNQFVCELLVVEPLGDVMDLVCQAVSGERIVARVPAVDGLRAGTTIRLEVQPERLHVFEPGDFGAALL